MRIIIVILVVSIFITSCDRTQKEQEIRSNYKVQAELDTTNLSLNCNMKVEWYNNSDSMINEIPFSFQLDSAKSLVQRIVINDQEIDFKYVSKETDGFYGFVLDLAKLVKPFQKSAIIGNYDLLI